MPKGGLKNPGGAPMARRGAVMTRACAWLCGLGVGFVLSLPALANDVGADPITFDEALGLGEETPGVRGASSRLEARQRGDEKIRGTAEATSVTFLPGALIWPREISGFDMQAVVTQGWNLGGLGGARRDSASLERGALAAHVRAKALRARLEAARRWIDLDTLEKIAEIIEERIKGAERVVERREHALAAEVGTLQPLTEARARLAQLRQRRLDLEGDRFSAATQLALAVGRAPAETRLETEGQPPEPALPDEEEIRERLADLDALPEVAVAKLRETAARARAVEASANYAPVLTTGAQLERTAGDLGAWVFYGIAGVTFRGPGQQQRSTSIAHADAAGAAVQTDAAMLQARAELEEALHDLKHSGEVIALLEKDTLPALHDLVETRERAVALGEDFYFALFEARDREHAAVEAAHRARGAHTWARVHMWLLLAELAREGVDR